MFPLRSNIFIATNLHWTSQEQNPQNWNLPNMDLTAFYRMQQESSFLPYLSLYQPYNNFLMVSDQSYFGHFTSQLNPTFNYYMCLDAKNLYASLFGKQCTFFLIEHRIYLSNVALYLLITQSVCSYSLIFCLF